MCRRDVKPKLLKLLLLACSVSLILWTPSFRNFADDVEQQVISGNVDVEQRMKQRRSHLKNVCKTMGKSIEGEPHFNSFYFIPFGGKRNNLAYCPTFKSGSTSLLHFFLKNMGRMDDGPFKKDDIRFASSIHVDARRVFRSCRKEDLNISRAFVLVRHPFSRLVSAYHNKLDVEAPDYSTYRGEAEKIVAKTRPRSAINRRRDNPTFMEFIEYLTAESPVQYDKHWMPTYVSCRPCSVDYEFIMKLETIQEDVKYVMNAVGVNAAGLERINQRNPDSMKTTKKYFENLPKEKLQQLYEKYKFDFELFDYRVTDIIS